jgi:hypothetical protein
MHNMQNKNHIVVLNSMVDDLVVSRETSQAWNQILVTLSTQVRKPGKEPKPLGDALHYSGSDIDAAAFARDADPDAIEPGFRLGRKTELAH